jgi:hypothetical protein
MTSPQAIRFKSRTGKPWVMLRLAFDQANLIKGKTL